MQLVFWTGAVPVGMVFGMGVSVRKVRFDIENGRAIDKVSANHLDANIAYVMQLYAAQADGIGTIRGSGRQHATFCPSSVVAGPCFPAIDLMEGE